MRQVLLMWKYLLSFCLAALMVFSFYILNDVSVRHADRKSQPLSIADYVNQLRAYARYTGDKRTGATSVLVLTYMRSGSSLTGDILQQASDSFYLYEPFRTVCNSIGENKPIVYVNGSTRLPPNDLEKEKVDGVLNWFRCDVGKIPALSLLDIFMKYGKKTAQAKQCFTLYKSLPARRRAEVCGQELQETCLNSPIRIIKSIRLELTSVSHLLDILPNMKILHLVRDPRATLASQSQLGKCAATLGGRYGCTQKFCKRLENDVLEEERLLKIYPDRIRTFFYEDIARYPLETAKKMFEFIGTPFTTAARDYVFNITMAGKADNCIVCTTRSNSSEHVDTWKKKMPKEFIDIVQDRCNYVLKRYKFDIVDTTL